MMEATVYLAVKKLPPTWIHEDEDKHGNPITSCDLRLDVGPTTRVSEIPQIAAQAVRERFQVEPLEIVAVTLAHYAKEPLP